MISFPNHWAVAQSVERNTVNVHVAGSIPASPAILTSLPLPQRPPWRGFGSVLLSQLRGLCLPGPRNSEAEQELPFSLSDIALLRTSFCLLNECEGSE